MWFVYVAVGLVLVTLGGLYARRRLAEALAHLGVRPRRVRIVRWAIAWLLFAFPVIMIVSIALTLALGRATMPRYDDGIAAWVLAVPFVWAMLVVVQALPWLLVSEVAYLIVRRRRGLARAVRLRAIAVVAVIGGFAIYTPVRVAVERGDLRVRHHQLAASPRGTPVPPFRIAFLADVQQDGHTDAPRARAVYARINASAPDVVLSGGDWINSGPHHITAAAAAAGTLRRRLGTFSVRGDHEHFAYVDRERSVRELEDAMRAHGIAMVNNDVRWFTHHGKRIAVVFLNYNYIQKVDRATVAALVARVQDADYSIVVTHQLDRPLAALLEGNVDLVLGAHTHGGQINPVVGVVHVALARLETPFVDGRYTRGATTFLITAGIGYSIVPVRYASPGSLELLDVRL